jgi:subtilisin family serine protease
MNFRILLLVLCFGFCKFNLHGQAKVIADEYIIQLDRGVYISSCLKDIQASFPDWNAEPVRILSKRFNIWLLNASGNFGADVSPELRKIKGIHLAQPNHAVELRSTAPNDPSYQQQWSLKNAGQSNGVFGADIDAELAWDLSTGGITAQGDTIVVAVIDDGFQLDHPDLRDNFFRNRSEIPANGIDDDLNGYTDDAVGWDAYQDDGTLPSALHGTHVCGIIAAKGNNNVGISGVNWNVKILPIAGSTSNEATVVAAYSYAAEMRIQYNQSGGTKGAFVIATNTSFGVNQGNPDDFPIWCSFYDTLGAYGIISAGATSNSNINIDQAGDIPTGCSSSFLISVTNTNRNDSKYPSAGYGIESIDIGAPGTDIYSTITNSSYSTRTGTSMASPHVSGTIALMYAVACPELLNEYNSNPAGIALQMKDYLLAGSDQLPELEALVNQNRRLNLYGALTQVQNYICNSNNPPNAAFYASSTSFCPGLTCSFLNVSSSNAESYIWSFPGGTPSVSTDKEPTIVYNETGIYDVQLISYNAFGADTLLLEGYIQITNTGLRTILSQDFESGDFSSKGWTVLNPDDSITWKVENIVGTFPGSKAASVNLYNYGGSNGQRDYLISPDFQLNQTTSNTLYFEHAYRRRSIQERDSLIVSVSTDQGNTWKRLLEVSEYGDGTFATNSILSSSFIPSKRADWCKNSTIGPPCFNLSLLDFDTASSARIRFETVNDGGNNVYIDNVKIQGICSAPQRMQELIAPENRFVVFPNPAQDFIQINTGSNYPWNASVVDLSGRIVSKIEGLIGNYFLPIDSLPAGMYLLRLQINDHLEMHRFIHTSTD